MSPYLSDHALVAYMLVGAPVLVWLGEMAVRRVERWLWSPRRSRVATHRLAVNDAMRRHPAGSRLCTSCRVMAAGPCTCPVIRPGAAGTRKPVRSGRWE